MKIKVELTKDQRQEIKHAAHDYANPKTKVIQSYCRLHDAFQAGALFAIQSIRDKKLII